MENTEKTNNDGTPKENAETGATNPANNPSGNINAGTADQGTTDPGTPAPGSAPAAPTGSATATPGNTDNNNSQAGKEEKLNTSNLNWPTFFTAGFIIVLTLFLFYSFIVVNKKIDKNKNFSIDVPWKNPDSIYIKPGPTWFLYDENSGFIRSLKIINDTDKAVLLALKDTSRVKQQSMGDTTDKKHPSKKVESKDSFSQAIDQLAFKSNNEKRSSYYLLILIFAICGAFGAQLRMIYRFIGVTCYKPKFDFKIWWPWYLLLPLLGAIIGPILFMLVEGNLLSAPVTANYSNFLIGLTIIAGFAADDFVNKISQLSETFWGKNGPPQETKKAPPTPTPTPTKPTPK